MADKTITQLTAIDAVATGDEFAVYDASATSTKKATAAQVKSFATDVDINGLTAVGTLATADSVAVYDASASANRKATIDEIKTLATNVDIDGMSATTPATNDTVPVFDTSASGNRKVTVQQIVDLANALGMDIASLTHVGTLATTDEFPIFDTSASGNKKATIADIIDLLEVEAAMDIHGLTAIPADSTLGINDEFPIWDDGAVANRKVTLAQIAKRFPVSQVSSSDPFSTSQGLLANSSSSNVPTTIQLGKLFQYLVQNANAILNSTVPASGDLIPLKDVSQAGAFQAGYSTVADLNAALDHGALAGLGDDDHTQYHNDTRGDARYGLYSTGTFTPGLRFGGGNTGMTFSTSPSGHYTKIGRLCFFAIGFVLSAKGSSTGTATIIDLPFSNIAGRTHVLLINMISATLTGDVIPQATVGGGTTEIALSVVDSGTNANMTDAHFTNTTTIRISGCYQTV